jgi:hypothetical protein
MTGLIASDLSASGRYEVRFLLAKEDVHRTPLRLDQ